MTAILAPVSRAQHMSHAQGPEPVSTSLALLERPGHSAAPMVNDVTRRRFITGAGAALLFAACSRAPQEESALRRRSGCGECAASSRPCCPAI